MAENSREIGEPNNRADIAVLQSDTKKAYESPSLKNASIIARLASPSLNPGKGIKGNKDSR